MKSIIAFFIFLSFSLAETQSIWKDVFEFSVVCDLEESDENEDKNEKKKELEDKVFHITPSNDLRGALKANQKKDWLNLHSVYNATYFPVNTPPPEV